MEYMKILLVTEYYPDSLKASLTGGVEARSFYMSQSLSQEHDVTILCSYQGNQKKDDYVGKVRVIRVGHIHQYTSFGAIGSRLRFAKALWKSRKKLPKCDIVDSYNFITYLPGYFIGRYLGAKCIATYHEVWVGEWVKNKGLVTGMFGSVWERIVLKLKWDKVVSVSHFTKKRLEKFIPPSKITVVPNGINLKDYTDVRVKKNKRPTIVCVGRMTPHKRHEDLIRALLLIRTRIPDINLKIVGDGSRRPELESLVKALEVEKQVEFVGFVSRHKDVIRHIKRSHLLVSCSTLEGFGIVLIEAMACGVPFVATDIPPFREVTKGGHGGLLYKPRDINELSRKCTSILTGSWVSTHCDAVDFDWTKIACRYMVLLEGR